MVSSGTKLRESGNRGAKMSYFCKLSTDFGRLAEILHLFCVSNFVRCEKFQHSQVFNPPQHRMSRKCAKTGLSFLPKGQRTSRTVRNTQRRVVAHHVRLDGHGDLRPIRRDTTRPWQMNTLNRGSLRRPANPVRLPVTARRSSSSARLTLPPTTPLGGAGLPFLSEWHRLRTRAPSGWPSWR